MDITLSSFGTVQIIKNFMAENEDLYTVPKYTCMAPSLSRLLAKIHLMVIKWGIMYLIMSEN